MLASDSDSDFEYPEGANSDASSDELLKGKLALGIDPAEMKKYDGRSTPKNGSQYLMKVMSEKKFVPKIAYADASSLPVRKKQGEGGDAAGGVPSYLDKFLQTCSAFQEESQSLGECSKLFPSTKWRKEVISNFSETRAKVERWQYQIESKEIRLISPPVKMPDTNDNTHWLKFCYGEAFGKLVTLHKSRTPQQKLADFFMDLYEPLEELVLLGANISLDDQDQAKNGKPSSQERCTEAECKGESDHGKNDLLQEKSDNDKGDTEDEAEEDEDTLTSPKTKPNELELPRPLVIGHRPLMSLVMRLNQNRIENLIKWNLMWLKNIGFVNECQGQWLYSILACIAKPVEPSIMSDMRTIARILLKTRNSISGWNSFFVEQTTDESQETPDGIGDGDCAREKVDEKVFDFINSLNLLIYIIADYFQQKDLIMNL